MEHDIPFGNSNRENGPTFLDFPLILGIFQWDEPTKRVPFTAEPEIPQILTKWKAPCVSRLDLFYLFYFICHTIITKNIGKEEKKKWRGDLTETIGAYERLGLFELRARAVSHQLKKRWRKVEDGKIYELFSYLII